MNSGHVTLAAPSGLQPPHAPHGQELAAQALLAQPAKEVVQTHAVTANYNQVYRLQLLAEQVHIHVLFSLQVLLLARNDDETIRLAEGRHRAGTLAHRIGDQARRRSFFNRSGARR